MVEYVLIAGVALAFGLLALIEYIVNLFVW